MVVVARPPFASSPSSSSFCIARTVTLSILALLASIPYTRTTTRAFVVGASRHNHRHNHKAFPPAARFDRFAATARLGNSKNDDDDDDKTMFRDSPTAFSRATARLESPSADRNKNPIWETLESEVIPRLERKNNNDTWRILETAAGAGVHTEWFVFGLWKLLLRKQKSKAEQRQQKQSSEKKNTGPILRLACDGSYGGIHRFDQGAAGGPCCQQQPRIPRYRKMRWPARTTDARSLRRVPKQRRRRRKQLLRFRHPRRSAGSRLIHQHDSHLTVGSNPGADETRGKTIARALGRRRQRQGWPVVLLRSLQAGRSSGPFK
mmetsp:Transcript_6599/g.14254  ORF Transcript_6599/g.14254 Transcript_6599/m.14254 type:complete len:320 (+) Transcript_6599:702-1661(+)